jgi:hypothetical protein
VQSDDAVRRIVRNAEDEAPVAIAARREAAVKRDRLLPLLRLAGNHQQSGEDLGVVQANARRGRNACHKNAGRN